ncbi:putative reverse transcriptase domain-containing protein, partial [Tanacetum coccineum]
MEVPWPRHCGTNGMNTNLSLCSKPINSFDLLRNFVEPLLDYALSISTPMKNNVVIGYEYRDCPLRFDDKIRSANLLPLEMSDFDIILGMDWLTQHRATIDCRKKRVIFDDLNNLEFIYHGSGP